MGFNITYSKMIWFLHDLGYPLFRKPPYGYTLHNNSHQKSFSSHDANYAPWYGWTKKNRFNKSSKSHHHASQPDFTLSNSWCPQDYPSLELRTNMFESLKHPERRNCFFSSGHQSLVVWMETTPICLQWDGLAHRAETLLGLSRSEWRAEFTLKNADGTPRI
jgi:hypothetical protein